VEALLLLLALVLPSGAAVQEGHQLVKMVLLAGVQFMGLLAEVRVAEL
jgi:hypothetical protein